MHRYVLISVLCGALLAQQQPPAAAPATAQQQDQDIRFITGVDYVSTPAWVYNRDGNTISGLRPEQFRLFDNKKEQNIQVDVSFTPISLVICLQANSHVQQLLPQLRKLGNLVKPLLIGEQGEAAVLSYHANVTKLQDFTSDADKITQATAKIFPGATSNRMIDAVSEATRMLRTRPRNRQ